MDRRDFLKFSGACVAGTMWSRFAVAGAENELGTLVFFESRYPTKADYPQEPSLKYGLKYVQGPAPFVTLADLKSRQIKRIATPGVRGHSAIRHPRQTNIMAVFPRAQKKGYLIDVSSGQVIQSLESQASLYFYGHGSFSADGKQLFTSEYNDKNEGVIVIRDTQNLKVVGQFPSYGLAPHDMHLVDGGKTFVIANNGKSDSHPYPKGPSSIVYVDIQSGKLLEKLDLEDLELAAQHLDADENGNVAIGMDWERPPNAKDAGQPRSLVAFYKRGGTLKIFKASEGIRRSLKENVLSIAWNRKYGKIAVTNPFGPLTFWDIAEEKYVQSAHVLHPHGVNVSRDGEHFIVCAADRIVSFSARDFKNQGSLVFAKDLANINSHSLILS